LRNFSLNLLYNYNSVFVCLFVRRRFRVLIDTAESARIVGQFRILMDWRNRARQIVRPGRRNSQGEETDRSFGLVDEILKAKRRSAGGAARGGDRRGWGQHGCGRIGGGGGFQHRRGSEGRCFFFFRFFLVNPHFIGGGWSGVATGYLHSFA
jgi:hypothetical protein